MSPCPILFLTTLILAPVAAIPIDNGVETEPDIECAAGYFTVNFLTRNNFDGHVYVKGHYNESQCRSDQTGRRTASIRLAFTGCGVQRTRSLNPKGIYVGAVVIISFHPKFITKVDRAYAMQCFYMEAEKPVVVQLEVSDLTTILQTQRVPMPVCRYEVLDGNIGGPPVRYAIVGQQVYHKWTCETDAVNIFCMYVNSCYVSDGTGDQVQILDASGCALDRYVLQNLEYISDLMAGQEAHVFKFADRTALYFQCQIAITVRDPQGLCPRPVCTTQSYRGPTGRFLETEVNRTAIVEDGTTFTQSTQRYTTTASFSTRTNSTITPRIVLTRTRIRRSQNEDLNVWDVRAPVINAFDVDLEGGVALALRDRQNGTMVTADQYCVQTSTAVFLLALLVSSVITMVIAGLVFCMRRRKREAEDRLY